MTEPEPETETQLMTGTQQRLGRRLGLEPYYELAEQSETLLRLESRPEANRTVGLVLLSLGVALLMVGLAMALSGLVSATAGAGFAVAALAAVLAGLIGGFGYQRIIGGYAILTTRNQIICDRTENTITFRQASKVGRARAQRLFFAQVGGLRLRRRPLVVGWLLRRVRPIVALELSVGDQIWIVDSAADVEALRPSAESLAAMLGQSLHSAG
jgi:hypothetical protein